MIEYGDTSAGQGLPGGVDDASTDDGGAHFINGIWCDAGLDRRVALEQKGGVGAEQGDFAGNRRRGDGFRFW